MNTLARGVWALVLGAHAVALTAVSYAGAVDRTTMSALDHASSYGGSAISWAGGAVSAVGNAFKSW